MFLQDDCVIVDSNLSSRFTHTWLVVSLFLVVSPPSQLCQNVVLSSKLDVVDHLKVVSSFYCLVSIYFIITSCWHMTIADWLNFASLSIGYCQSFLLGRMKTVSHDFDC